MDDSVVEEMRNMIKACGRTPADFAFSAGEQKQIVISNAKNGKTRTYDSSRSGCVMELAMDLKTGNL